MLYLRQNNQQTGSIKEVVPSLDEQFEAIFHEANSPLKATTKNSRLQTLDLRLKTLLEANGSDKFNVEFLRSIQHLSSLNTLTALSNNNLITSLHLLILFAPYSVIKNLLISFDSFQIQLHFCSESFFCSPLGLALSLLNKSTDTNTKQKYMKLIRLFISVLETVDLTSRALELLAIHPDKEELYQSVGYTVLHVTTFFSEPKCFKTILQYESYFKETDASITAFDIMFFGWGSSHEHNKKQYLINIEAYLKIIGESYGLRAAADLCKRSLSQEKYLFFKRVAKVDTKEILSQIFIREEFLHSIILQINSSADSAQLTTNLEGALNYFDMIENHISAHFIPLLISLSNIKNLQKMYGQYYYNPLHLLIISKNDPAQILKYLEGVNPLQLNRLFFNTACPLSLALQLLHHANDRNIAKIHKASIYIMASVLDKYNLLQKVLYSVSPSTVDKRSKNYYHYSTLHIAAVTGNLSIFKNIITAEKSLGTIDFMGYTPADLFLIKMHVNFHTKTNANIQLLEFFNFIKSTFGEEKLDEIVSGFVAVASQGITLHPQFLICLSNKKDLLTPGFSIYRNKRKQPSNEVLVTPKPPTKMIKVVI